MRSPRFHPAFTLLELILVMLLITLVLAWSAPNMRRFGRARQASDAATNILALTEYARSASITNARIYRLNIEDNTYQLTMQQQEQFVALGTSAGRTFELPQNMSIQLLRQDQAFVNFIAFYPTGRLDPATIRLTDSEGRHTDIASSLPTAPFALVAPEEAGP